MTTYELNGDYTPERGFGLITDAARAANVTPGPAQLNAGFEPQPWYRAGEPFRAGQSSGVIPSLVRVDVPMHGDYAVTLTIAQNRGDRAASGAAADSVDPVADARYGDISDTGLADRDVLVFAGPRQLVFKGELPVNGDPIVVETTVNVSDFVPRSVTELARVNHLMLAVVGVNARPVRVTVEPAPALTPTVWIAGDSTVTNEPAQYPYAPSDTYCGWGACLPAWLDGSIAVSNHARSGLTSVTFRSEGHYAPVQSDWRPGDYFLIQFGHNDQKRPELDARGGYWRELDRYIREAREAGVYPILVTSLARNTWNADGTYNDLLHDWASAVIDLGRERQVPVLDLHARSMALLKDLGDESARPMFHAGDRTHMHDVGAYRMAGIVASEITRVLAHWEGRNAAETQTYRALAGHMTAGFGDWPLPPRAHDLDRPQLVVDQYLNPLYLKYTAEPYITGDISPFRKAMMLTPVGDGTGEPGSAAVECAGKSVARPLDVLLYVGRAIDPEPVVKAHPELAGALAAGHAVALIAYLAEEIEQDPSAPAIPPAALDYLRANAARFGINPIPLSVGLLG